jgi:hypothetical protein
MFAIKAEVGDARAQTFSFPAHKTMYGGKRIAEGDTIYVFASENEGGSGLIAMGVVASVKAIPKKRGSRDKRRASASPFDYYALAKRRLGRAELKRFADGATGGPKRSSTSSSIARRRTRSSA